MRWTVAVMGGAEVLLAGLLVAFVWMISDLSYSFEARDRGPMSYIALVLAVGWIGVVLVSLLTAVVRPSSRAGRRSLERLAVLNVLFVGAIAVLILSGGPLFYAAYALPPAILAFLAHRLASGDAHTAHGPELLPAR